LISLLSAQCVPVPKNDDNRLISKKIQNNPARRRQLEHDNDPSFCQARNKIDAKHSIRLPETACLPINRCNLPAAILGSLAFQSAPVPLELDGVGELHRDLFRRLDAVPDAQTRAGIFRDYMTVRFRLEHLDEAGLTETNASRANANYITLLRGWRFDSNNREGAALKGWVESRFGLAPRYHGEALREPESDAHRHYQHTQAWMCYGANALEAQLDLVYAYCQYEFARATPGVTHLTLYRGVNRLEDHELLGGTRKEPILLLNNLNSCTSIRERAEEFGDIILTLQVPVAKIFFHGQLLPGMSQSEAEFLVVGGIYEVQSARG
jgi:NAD+--dinitrogen-reductase ADP-D-ribosyltransferase